MGGALMFHADQFVGHLALAKPAAGSLIGGVRSSDGSMQFSPTLRPSCNTGATGLAGLAGLRKTLEALNQPATIAP